MPTDKKYDVPLDMTTENSLSKIIQQIGRGSKVLEFGPAAGRMTKYLKETLGCEVFIVEYDPEYAAHASQYAKDCFVGDAEGLEWLERWRGEAFDFICFADVLEHLRNPQAVLSHSKQLLKPDGKILLSVPNVAHNAILIDLFNNRFNYTPTGLLDNTHIHLFTIDSLRRMAAESGLVPVIEDATYVNVDETPEGGLYNQVPENLNKILTQREYSVVYQYVFTLQTRDFVRNHSVLSQKLLVPHSVDFTFQVFFVRDGGISEEKSSSIRFNPLDTSEFFVPVHSGERIESVRIDPINISCCMRVDSIRFVKTEGFVDLDVNGLNTNALVRSLNNFYFETDDPNIYVPKMDFSDVTGIEVKIAWLSEKEFISAVKSAISSQRAQIDEQRAQIDEQRAQIDEQRAQIDEQRAQIRDFQSKLENRESEIRAMRNSWSWKVTRPLRGAKKIVRKIIHGGGV